MVTQRDIVRAFGGGNILRDGNVLVAAPGHSRLDRSLSILPLADGRILHNTFSPRDDRLSLLRYAEHKLGIARTRPTRATATSKFERSAPDIPALWQACIDPAGTPVELYLSRRGVLEPAKAAFGHAIRFHPKFPFGGNHVPCMVALITNMHTAQPQALHRTALDPDGQKIAVDGKDRMALGPTKDGCVRLTPDEDVTTCLGVGEGIETTLSMQTLPEFDACPVWACLNANGIANFPVLSGIEVLWIAVDNDAAGLTAANTCAGHWADAGREVFTIKPIQAHRDLNDVCGGRRDER
jgi:hypothetical protein